SGHNKTAAAIRHAQLQSALHVYANKFRRKSFGGKPHTNVTAYIKSRLQPYFPHGLKSFPDPQVVEEGKLFNEPFKDMSRLNASNAKIRKTGSSVRCVKNIYPGTCNNPVYRTGGCR